MRSILKLLLATASCMMLCSCPAGTYIKYELVGGQKTGFNDYETIITKNSDTIRLKVGVVDSRIHKTTAVIVRFENLKSYKFNIISTKYGELHPDDKDRNIYKKVIEHIKRKDTVILSHNSEKFYFTIPKS